MFAEIPIHISFSFNKTFLYLFDFLLYMNLSCTNLSNYQYSCIFKTKQWNCFFAFNQLSGNQQGSKHNNCVMCMPLLPFSNLIIPTSPTRFWHCQKTFLTKITGRLNMHIHNVSWLQYREIAFNFYLSSLWDSKITNVYFLPYCHT